MRSSLHEMRAGLSLEGATRSDRKLQFHFSIGIDATHSHDRPQGRRGIKGNVAEELGVSMYQSHK